MFYGGVKGIRFSIITSGTSIFLSKNDCHQFVVLGMGVLIIYLNYLKLGKGNVYLGEMLFMGNFAS